MFVIAGGVGRRGTGGRAGVIARRDGGLGGFFPLGLFGVGVYVEPLTKEEVLVVMRFAC